MVHVVSFIPPEECFSNFASEKLLPVAFAFQFPVPGSDSAQLIFTSEMILSRKRFNELKNRTKPLGTTLEFHGQFIIQSF